MTVEAEHTLDTSGLFCPEPVMLLHNKVAELQTGETLRVIATDPTTQRDIPRFCRFLGHELLVEEVADGVFVYLLRKGAG
ncbi:sulfurtransferase TusA family protein [Haliea atlantica]|nr:sulfurtransferase TusA [Haliea sp.]MAL95867.1 sulfurtransferase TusA [Haliea sp.]